MLQRNPHVLRKSGLTGNLAVSGSGLDPLESERALRHLRSAFLGGTDVRTVPMTAFHRHLHDCFREVDHVS